MRLSINTFDSRCEFGSPVSLVDLDNANRLVSCHGSVIDAANAKALLLYQADRRYADPELNRFPVGTGKEALASLADVNRHRH
jgi:hypothetical protein